MTRVRVYNPDAEGISAGDINLLLMKAECEIVADGEPASSVIVFLTEDLRGDVSLESALESAVGEGMCIVAVWPPVGINNFKPDAIEKLLSSLIDWDPAKLLKAAKCSAEEDQFCGADGIPRPQQHVEHNSC